MPTLPSVQPATTQEMTTIREEAIEGVVDSEAVISMELEEEE